MGNPRILVADADRRTAGVLSWLLAEQGFDASVAHPPAAVDQALRWAVPDLLLVDGEDTDLAGLVRRVRREGRFAPMRIIAATASVDELPVQLHVAEPDPFETDDWLSAWYLQMGRAGADVEVYRYAGAGHLYTDPDLPDYDEEAAEATGRVALGFLETL